MMQMQLDVYMRSYPKFVASYAYRNALLHDFDVEEISLKEYSRDMILKAAKAYADFDKLCESAQVVAVMQMVINDIRICFQKAYGKP